MENGERKNVIWIFGDQHRGQALACNGDPNVLTPNIDNLAETGVNFTNAVAGFPLCCPFRGSLISGKYPHKCVPGHEYRMPAGPTVATAFNANGYDTAYFGKWHIDGHHTRGGQDRGAFHIVPTERRGDFNTWIGYENNNSQWDCWVHGGRFENTPHLLEGYETDALTDLLIEYITKKAKTPGAPFFAVLSVQPPHQPYQAPARFRRLNPADIALRSNVPPGNADRLAAVRRNLVGYYAMIENLDWNVGRIRAALRKAGLDLDTHILFFSDHGDMHGSHGYIYKTRPYQESIGIPMIIGAEQHKFNGRRWGRIHAPLNHVDIAPTTLGLCSIDKPQWMEGTDYSHYRISSRAPDPDGEPNSAFLQSVIPPPQSNLTNRPWRGVITKNRWKYVCFNELPWLMFNLEDDPYEMSNLVHDHKYREEQLELHGILADWIDRTDDDFALPDING